MLFIFALLLIVILVVLVRCIVIVPQSNAYVTEWLGVYKDTWGAGLHIRTPFVERISRKVSLKEEAADFPPQPVITRDNVTMMIDTVVFFQVFDAKMYAYGVNRPIQAIENLSATTLRDIIGSMTLDETLTSRDLINTKITASLDEATDRWGIKVNRVELKNIEPPVEIRQAMEKQIVEQAISAIPAQVNFRTDFAIYFIGNFGVICRSCEDFRRGDRLCDEHIKPAACRNPALCRFQNKVCAQGIKDGVNDTAQARKFG